MAHLMDADDLMVAAIGQTIVALGPPESDAALAALALTLGRAIDDMPPALRPTMLPQASGQLLKVLQELEGRAAKRRAAERQAGKGNRVRELQAAHQLARRKRVS
jgi:hypothetical protein